MAALGVAGLSLVELVAAPAQSGAPTYNEDVGPILLEKCASCHRPEQVAPMSFLTYEEVRPWASAIRDIVASREMPPEVAPPESGPAPHHVSLSPDEISTIVAWVDAGAPEGAGSSPERPRPGR